MRASRPALFACVLAAGCARTFDPADLALREDEVIAVLAFVDTGGAALAVELLPAPSLAISRALDSDAQEVLRFSVARGDLVGADGAPIGPERLAGARARLLSQPASEGSCGWCRSPTGVPPQIVSAGDSCAPPMFARAERAGAGIPVFGAVEAARRSVRVDFAGRCDACAPLAESRTEVMKLEPIVPGVADGGWPPEAIAQLADGTVAVFSERVTAIVPAGQRASEPRAPPEPFEGPILAAAGLPDGSLLVASAVPAGGERRVRTDRVDRALGRTRLPGLPSEITPLRITVETRAVRVIGQRFSGRDLDGVPAMVWCPLDPLSPFSGEACSSSDWNRDAGWVSPAATGSATISAGRVAVLAAHGEMTFAHAGGPALSLRRLRSIAELDDEELDRSSLHTTHLAAIGDRLFVCGYLDRRSDRHLVARVFTATVTAKPADMIWRAPRFDREGTCRGLFHLPGVIRASTGDRFYDFDASGDLVGEHDALAISGVDREIKSADSLAPGWTVIAGKDGDVWRARWGERAERIVGPEAPLEGASAIAAAGTDLWAFTGARGAWRVRPGEAPARVAITGLPPGALPRAAAFDSRNRELIAGGAGPPGWLARVDPGTGVARLVGGVGAPVLGLSEVAPGLVVVVLGTTRSIRLLRDGELDPTPVEIRWDDPFTPEEEPSPRSSCEGRPLPGDPEATPFRAIDSARGVAWIAGCDGSLLRLGAYGRPPIAERVGLSVRDLPGLQDDPQLPRPLRAVRALCSGEIALGVEDESAGVLRREAGPLFRLTPRDDAATRGDGFSIEAAHEHELPGGLGLDPGPPVALTGDLDDRGLAILFPGSSDLRSGSVLGFGGGRRIRMASPAGAAAAAGGRLLIGTEEGRLFSGSLARP